MLSALAVDQCFKSVHWQLMDFAMREEDKPVMSTLAEASSHRLLLCLDVLSMFTGHVLHWRAPCRDSQDHHTQAVAEAGHFIINLADLCPNKLNLLRGR